MLALPVDMLGLLSASPETTHWVQGTGHPPFFSKRKASASQTLGLTLL